MTSLWVIIRSDVTEAPVEEQEPPTVCGVYASREEAVEEIIKLYIEDDIDLVGNTNEDNKEREKEEYDYRPTPNIIKEQRARLLVDEYYTYTNRGNLYTLVECVLGAKHEFEEDVLQMYEASQ